MQGNTSALVVARSGRVQDGLYALLEAAPQIEMIGLVHDGAAALKLVVEHKPALVLLDTNLSEDQALAVLRQIKAVRPQTRCIVLADNIQQQQRVKAAGADAVLLKGFPMTQFFATMERLLGW